MGGGTYDMEDRVTRATTMGYHTKSVHENFKQREVHNQMDPSGVVIREARDSEEHPNSLAIILALDLTGSMGYIPQHLVQDGLPNIMGSIIQKGVKDPQLLFLGVGDHECDQSPLQVGQFESDDELLDNWLTQTYLEGGGGGNAGESYLLAWMFAGMHTSIDCFEKRKEKGFLFTIGDEKTLKSIPGHALDEIMGRQQHKKYTALELLDKARETYEVFHLHLREGSNGRDPDVMADWKQLMGKDHLIIVDSHKDVSKIISDKITEREITETTSNSTDAPTETDSDDPEKLML